MRPLSLLPTALLLATLTTADDIVTKSRIKVQLFAAPAFVSEVSVDAYHMQCLSLDNNLIDGRVQSLLVGGHDIAAVLKRDDYWNCVFYSTYDCKESEDSLYAPSLSIPDGVNNLASIGWGTRIRSLRCRNYGS